MAHLQFVDFALMLNPARKEKHFRLPDDFPNIDINYSLTDEPSRVWFSRGFHNTNGPLFGDPRNVLHNEGEARNFKVSALRGRNRRLLAAGM